MKRWANFPKGDRYEGKDKRHDEQRNDSSDHS